jgi:hypothetical protein
MKKILALMMVILMTLVFSGVAMAHTWGPNDSDLNDNEVVIYSSTTKYENALQDAMARWNAFDTKHNNNGVRFKQYQEGVTQPAELEIFDYTDCNDWAAGRMYFTTDGPIIKFNTCDMDQKSGDSRRWVASHELGHSIGAHHFGTSDTIDERCPLDKVDKSVMVTLCQSRDHIIYPGSHDETDYVNFWVN